MHSPGGVCRDERRAPPGLSCSAARLTARRRGRPAGPAAWRGPCPAARRTREPGAV